MSTWPMALKEDRHQACQLDQLLLKLRGVRQISKGQYKALCPAHDDHNPSLSISEGAGGKVLLTCHAGCTYSDIMKAVGLNQACIGPDLRSVKSGQGREIESYCYEDAQCNAVYEVVRYADPKGFKQRKPDGNGGWLWTGPGDHEKVLYNLPQVKEAIENHQTVFVVEGEKDANRLAKLGLCGTTNAGGAGKWLLQYSESLRGGMVVILPDNDAPGRKHALLVAESIKDFAASVKIVALPGLPEKGDVSDWIQSGGVSDALRALVDAAPLYDSRQSLPDPVPLGRAEEAASAFPVNALPPLMAEAVQEYARYGQQPLPMIAGSAIASLSLAAQGLADVRRDSVLVGPIGVYVLTVAESGERKTAIDNAFSKEIRAWCDERREQMRPQIKDVQALHDAWELELKALQESFGKASRGNDTVKKDELRARLVELKKNEPPIPKLPQVFFSDVNAASLGAALTGGYPSAALWSNEAMLFVGGDGMQPEKAMSMLGMLNGLWDNGRHSNTRKVSTSTEIEGCRFTANLMMQDVIFKALMGGGKGLARGSGNLARFLVSRPESTIGRRFYREPPATMPAMEAFNRRIRALLETPLSLDERNALQPNELLLSPEAKAEWIEYHNGIEEELGALREYEAIKDFGAKAAENAARLAALFHVFELGPAGTISGDVMTRACSTMLWYINEARRVFALIERPREELDAQKLLEWAIHKHGSEEKWSREFGQVYK